LKHPTGIPEPKDLWGDYTVQSWTHKERGMFAIWIWGIASVLVFTDQNVTDRVHSKVQSIIDKAKAGEISYQEAIDQVRPMAIFSDEELKIASMNAQEYGPMMAKFFQDTPINN
jgi:hypothetical protein